jgi:hypothetical protein
MKERMKQGKDITRGATLRVDKYKIILISGDANVPRVIEMAGIITSLDLD